MAHHVQDWAHQVDQRPEERLFEPTSPCSERQRSASVGSDAGSSPKPMRSYRQPNLDIRHVRTRSVAFGAGVIIERDFTAAPTDDDIIIVTVKTTSKLRKNSIDGSNELPSRPRPRSFLRRMSTRLHSPNDECKYKAMKMPRRDYKRYFARDHDRKYIGTEPEREWDEEDLMKEFGMYQDLPLRSILC